MAGATKARAVARPLLDDVRQAVGLRKMVAVPRTTQAETAAKTALPVFKQYREADGFHFKFTAADGTLLLQAGPFAEGREAGQWVKRLKTEGAPALQGSPIRTVSPLPQVEAALAALQASEA